MPTNTGLEDIAPEFFKQQAQSSAQQIRNNVIQAVGVNPDADASLQHLAKFVGVPSDTVRAMPETIKQQASVKLMDADKLAQDFPHTARFMQVQDNVNKMHDDVPGTAAVEQAVKALPAASLSTVDPSAPPAPTPTISSRLMDGANYIFSKPDTGDTLMGDLGKVLSGGGRVLAGTGKYLTLAASTLDRPVDALLGTNTQEGALALTKSLDDYSQSGPTKQSSFKDQLLNVVGNTAGVLGEAALTGGTSVAPKAGAALFEALSPHIAHGVQAMMVPASVASQDTYNSVLQATGDPVQASKAALASYTTSTLGGVVPFATPGKLAYRMTSGAAMGPLLGDVSHTAMNAALPSTMQQPARDVQDRALDAVMGSMFGGMAGPHDVADINRRITEAAYQSHLDAIKNEADVQGIQALHGLGQVSAVAKLRERDPAAFKAFVEQVTEDGHLKEVYVDHDTLTNALNQSGVTTADMQEAMPGVLAQMQESRTTGADVRIPVADYATHLAGTPIDDAIIQHLKTSADGKTYAEAQTFYQNQVESLKGTVDKILAEKDASDTAQVSRGVIRDEVLKQLNEVNRFRPDVNRLHAEVIADHRITRAQQADMTPEQFADAYKLKFTTDMATGRSLDQSDGLSPEHKAVETAAFEQIKADPQGLVDRYLKLHGNTIDPDLVKEMFPAFKADPSLAAAVHEPSSKLAKLIYAQALKSNKGKPVVFTAGGGGSGKSEAGALARDALGLPKNGLVMDSTLSSFDSARSRIDQALASGSKVDIVYTNRHVNDAFKGAMSRDRVVPIDVIARAHVGASDTIRQLKEHYEGNPNVKIAVINNLGAPSEMHLGKLDDVPRYDHNEVERGLHDLANQARESGQITPEKYDATTRPGLGRSDEALASEKPGQDLGQPIQGAGRPDGEATGGRLDQPARGQIAFGDDITKQPTVISLLKDADLSTTVHELGHFFLEVDNHLTQQIEARIASGADVSPGERSILTDHTTALDWMGVKATADMTETQRWASMSLEEKRPYHEKFARGFETYLMEGKAPSVGLAKAFQSFRSWLVNVYKSLTSLNAELTPEVRAVFDRMLASDEAIKQAESVRGYKSLFDAKPDGMTDAEFADYQALGKQSTEDAITTMQARSIRDMQWLTNAKSKALKDLQNKARSARKAVQEQVTQEVDANPAFAAKRFIDEATDPLSGYKSDMKDWRAKRDEVPKAGREEWVKANPEPVKPSVEAGKLPVDMQIVADRFGFDTPEDMVKAISDAGNRKEVIEGMTDQRMLEQHGDLVDKPSMERAAEAAIHNEARARFMATGLRALSKSPIPAKMIHEAARQAAASAVDAKVIKDLRPAQYAAAEAKANAEAIKLAPSDTESAVKAQQAALLNNQLFKHSSDAITTIEAGLRYLKKFDKATIRENLDGAFLERIDQIKATLDLRRSPPDVNPSQESLITWADGLRNLGYEPQIADWLNQLAAPKHYQDATVEQFRQVVDAVKSLEHIAREMKNITVEGKKIAVKEAVNQLVARMDERGQKFSNQDLLEKPTAKVDGVWKATLNWLAVHLRMVHGDLLSPEYKINRFDMHDLLGPFRSMILDPILAGNYRKVDMTKRQSDMMGKMGEALGKDWQKSLYDGVSSDLLDPALSKPGMPVPMKMTRGRMLGIARHVGNESNLKKLTEGYKWDSTAVWSFLEKNMTKKDWQATQAHWDSFDPLWKESEEMIRRQGGVPPPKIPARTFDIRTRSAAGEPAETMTLRGGYSPIDYDPIRSKLAVRHGEFDLGPGDKVGEQMNYRATTTHNSSMVARSQGYSDAINLDFHSAEGRIRDTIHDLAYREALLDVGKIVNDGTFRQKFMETYGREEYVALTDWLSGVRDMGSSDPRNRGFEKAMQYARQGVVLTGIGYRVSTVLKHGGAAALKSLGYLGNAEGAKYFAVRVARMASGHMQEDLNAAREKFPEIRARMLQMDRDYKAGNRSMYESEDWRAKNDRFGHAMVAWSDALSATPTAWAAYDLAKTSGVPKSMGGTGEPMTEAQAVAYANSVVRQAHGSALEATRSNFMQSGSINGLFGALYGFMNNTYGQTADMLDKSVSQGYFKNNPAVAARLFATLLIPAVWTQWLKDSGPGDEESTFTWAGKAVAAEVGAMVPFVRDAVSMLEYGRGGTIAPMQMVTDVVNSGKDIWNESQGKQTRLIQDLSNAIGEWAHIAGFGQLGHILQYMRDEANGKKNPENAAMAVKEAVIGGHAHH